MHIPDIIQCNVSLKNHSTLNIGGDAKYFSSPTTEDEIIELIKWVRQNNIQYFVIGHGSNLLFDDEGYQGLIIKLADNFSKTEIIGQSLIVQSGAWMPFVARKTQVAGLTGLEHTVGIPGNIGGIVTMNAGSQRQSVSTKLVKIRYLDENLIINKINVEDCEFGYRKSIFQNNDWIILEAEFRLSKGDKVEIRRTMKSILKQRRLKFPRKFPNCGSVFKSDPIMYQSYGPPGKIIEQLGLKGIEVGGMCISAQHANFFINQNKATAEDFKRLLILVKDKAEDKLGVKLKEEVVNVTQKGWH